MATLIKHVRMAVVRTLWPLGEREDPFAIVTSIKLFGFLESLKKLGGENSFLPCIWLLKYQNFEIKSPSYLEHSHSLDSFIASVEISQSLSWESELRYDVQQQSNASQGEYATRVSSVC